MNHKNNGLAVIAIVLATLGVAVLGIGGYMAINSETFNKPKEAHLDAKDINRDNESKASEENVGTSEAMVADSDISIAWRFTDADEIEFIPYTNVSVVINGNTHEIGKFTGSCNEIDDNGGIDGQGLLAGELSGAQCWFAGGGGEIGVFAHEDGGVDIMTGELGEGGEGFGMFRGNFKVKKSIEF